MNVCFSIDFFMECEFEEFNEFTPVTAFFDFNYNTNSSKSYEGVLVFKFLPC